VDGALRSSVPTLAVGLLLALGGCASPPGATPEPDGLPSVSSPLALTPDGRTLWVVNPDAHTVTALDTRTLVASAPVPVGREPWAVAVTPSGVVVVMNREDGSLTLLDSGRATDLFVGAEPGGLALSPSGRLAYVTLSSSDEIAVVDLSLATVVERRPVGRLPWAVGVTDDGDLDDDDETIVVAHRQARLRPGGAEATDDGKEGWLTFLSAAGGAVREVPLDPDGFGFPNGLEGLALHDGETFVVHGLNRPEPPRDFEHTVSGALSRVGLVDGTVSLRQDLNDEAFSTPTNGPTAVALAPDGRTAYVVLAGSDAVMGVDLTDPLAPVLLGFWPTGSNPRGIVLTADGTRAFVSNVLSRDVSVLDLVDVAARPEIARVTVTPETLSPTLLRGKVLFHLAADPRLSQLGWIACASCHPSGGADGTTWLTPDGPRQTQPLWQLRGTAPFHASATRDEVQDFEHDVEILMAGSGLAPGLAARELGEPNGGRSEDLDALAAYVLDGIRVPRAPAAADVAAGRALFASLGCIACHAGPAWTTSALPGPVGSLSPTGEVEVVAALRDVGTFDAAHGGLGENGFDVPTLLGLHASAPYLHDGSAGSLADVLANPVHVGRTLSDGEVARLVEFLESIDGQTPSF
jgi:YVTN family beta-propeller protein